MPGIGIGIGSHLNRGSGGSLPPLPSSANIDIDLRFGVNISGANDIDSIDDQINNFNLFHNTGPNAKYVASGVDGNPFANFTRSSGTEGSWLRIFSAPMAPPYTHAIVYRIVDFGTNSTRVLFSGNSSNRPQLRKVSSNNIEHRNQAGYFNMGPATLTLSYIIISINDVGGFTNYNSNRVSRVYDTSDRTDVLNFGNTSSGGQQIAMEMYRFLSFNNVLDAQEEADVISILKSTYPSLP